MLCLVIHSCPTPWTVARQAPLPMGFSRQEYWSGLPCPPPGDLPNSGTEQADSLHLSHQGSIRPFIVSPSVSSGAARNTVQRFPVLIRRRIAGPNYQLSQIFNERFWAKRGVHSPFLLKKERAGGGRGRRRGESGQEGPHPRSLHAFRGILKKQRQKSSSNMNSIILTITIFC